MKWLIAALCAPLLALLAYADVDVIVWAFGHQGVRSGLFVVALHLALAGCVLAGWRELRPEREVRL